MELDKDVIVGKSDNIPPAQRHIEVLGDILRQFGR
jgi:hypothetical protein